MKRHLALIVVLSLSLPIVSATESNDFSNSITLDSGVMVSGYVTESDGDNPDDKYQLLVSPGDTIHLDFTSDEVDICIYIGENGNEELDCFYEGNFGEGGVSLYKREITQNYYVKIDCGSTALECSSSAEYTLKITIYPDEAGDTLEDAEELLPEVRINGWAALDDSAEPIDFDYYRTPVIEGDTVRIVITSSDMTSYRIYDQYGIKIGDGYEEGNYDFVVNFDYSGDLFIELFCTQNYGEPCDYNLIAIGSTYVESTSSSDIDSESDFSNDFYRIVMFFVIIFAFLIVTYFRRMHSQVFDSMQPKLSNENVERSTKPPQAIDEIQRLQQTVTQTEREKMQMQDELEKAKSTTVVQNITYNIQDSAISGDINATGLKEKDD